MKKKDIAKYLGVHPSLITRQLEGKRGISYRTAQKYSKKLGVPWSEVMAMAVDGKLDELFSSIPNQA